MCVCVCWWLSVLIVGQISCCFAIVFKILLLSVFLSKPFIRVAETHWSVINAAVLLTKDPRGLQTRQEKISKIKGNDNNNHNNNNTYIHTYIYLKCELFFVFKSITCPVAERDKYVIEFHIALLCSPL